MMRNLPAALLLMTLGMPFARAACDWSQFVEKPSWRAVYAGKVGIHPVRMMLHLDTATKRFDGAYGYNDQPEMLTLTGTMRPGGVGADLEERDAQGRVTGYFSLGFYRLRPHDESPVQFQKYQKKSPSKCFYLNGTWRPAPGQRTLLVTLQQAGPDIDPVDDKWRVINEATAYKLKQALMHQDRRAFAVLLKYPFHTATGELPVMAWKNQSEVIRKYKKIMRHLELTLLEITNANPNILFTWKIESEFMNGSVWINQGKIILMCAGPCSPFALAEVHQDLETPNR